MEVAKILSKEDEAFMPGFFHSYGDHRKSLTVLEDIFYCTNFKNKFGELASAALTKFFLRNTTCNPEQARQFHLAQQGTRSQHMIWFTLPHMELAV